MIIEDIRIPQHKLCRDRILAQNTLKVFMLLKRIVFENGENEKRYDATPEIPKISFVETHAVPKQTKNKIRVDQG